ncbi:MAG: hypothetical protein ACOY3P_02090 [Planctomycetota bacterium]
MDDSLGGPAPLPSALPSSETTTQGTSGLSPSEPSPPPAGAYHDSPPETCPGEELPPDDLPRDGLPCDGVAGSSAAPPPWAEHAASAAAASAAANPAPGPGVSGAAASAPQTHCHGCASSADADRAFASSGAAATADGGTPQASPGAKEPYAAADQVAGQDPRRHAGQDARQDAGQPSGQNTSQPSGQDSSQHSGQDTAARSTAEQSATDTRGQPPFTDRVADPNQISRQLRAINQMVLLRLIDSKTAGVMQRSLALQLTAWKYGNGPQDGAGTSLSPEHLGEFAEMAQHHPSAANLLAQFLTPEQLQEVMRHGHDIELE